MKKKALYAYIIPVTAVLGVFIVISIYVKIETVIHVRVFQLLNKIFFKRLFP